MQILWTSGFVDVYSFLSIVPSIADDHMNIRQKLRAHCMFCIMPVL